MKTFIKLANIILVILGIVCILYIIDLHIHNDSYIGIVLLMYTYLFIDIVLLYTLHLFKKELNPKNTLKR